MRSSFYEMQWYVTILSGDSSTSEISVKKSAGNISHLVKKRSNDEKTATGDASPKKPRLETNGSSSNGASSSNGH